MGHLLFRVLDFNDLAVIGDFDLLGNAGDLHRKGSARPCAAVGYGLGLALEAGVDRVEQREPSLLDRAQLPDCLDGLVRLEAPEVEGLLIGALGAPGLGGAG